MEGGSDHPVILELDCGERSEPNEEKLDAELLERRKRAVVLHRKMRVLGNTVSILHPNSGFRTLRASKHDEAPIVQSYTHVDVNIGSVDGQLTVTSPGTISLTPPQSRANINIIRNSRGPQSGTSVTTVSSVLPLPSPAVLARQQLVGSTSASIITNSNLNMNQVVFDPNSGLLLCPSSNGSTLNQGQSGNVRPYKAIQATPEILAAINSGTVRIARPMLMNGVPVTRIVHSMARPSSQTTTTTALSNRGPNVTYATQKRVVASEVAASMRAATNTTSGMLNPGRTIITQNGPAVRMFSGDIQNSGTVLYSGNARGNSPQTQLTNSTGAIKANPTELKPIPNFTAIAPRPGGTQPSQIVNGFSHPITTTAGQMQSKFPNVATSQIQQKKYQSPSTAAPASASFIKKPPPNKPKGSENQSAEGTQNEKEGDNSKTFPSLVVLVKPCLQEKKSKAQAQVARADLDLKVKTILMHSPSKLTEWLMQKELLRVDHKCYEHLNSDRQPTPYKLGMYSDGGSKQPFSGGYVWISDCCPDKQISVFQGSIFEASLYPPVIIMKLIYHWACQTPANNVMQWVKITSYYLKNFYTLLRSACVAGLHENSNIMGGKGKYIEVGIITLGTTVASTAGQKQVKIEILGVFDPSAKYIRLKVINPTAGLSSGQAHRERIDQIMSPLNNWVDKHSVVLIDQSLDKSLLERMGFRNISQSKGIQNQSAKSTIPTNVNVMNYLKNIVPKMFQNTLCVLSKSLIQQFLDELSWRELWGGTPSQTFDTMISQLVQMTKAETGEPLISRLNKISLNPFGEWSYMHKKLPLPTGIECLPDSIRGGSSPFSELAASAANSRSSMTNVVSNYIKTSIENASNIKTTAGPKSSQIKRKSEPAQDDVAKFLEMQKMLNSDKRTHTLQAYYYVYCPSPMESYKAEFPQNLKCPLCSKSFKSNTEALAHLIGHVLNPGRINSGPYLCRYCLKDLQTQSSLNHHVMAIHKRPDVPNLCRICNDKFPTETQLIMHMWKRHTECEAPYRCEVCDYRSSFHNDLVDHFHKEHTGTDTMQCPVCLKALSARTITCLKQVVVHLQNHVVKKGKKCQDCCLVFSTDVDHRSHLMNDAAHDSRRHKNFAQHTVEDTPIRMPRPPPVSRDLTLPPPSKKTKTTGKSSPSVQTLNSSFAIPLNPNDKFMYTSMKIKISDLDSFEDMDCWECRQPIRLNGHYRGTMKCSKCRYETCCHFAMHDHIRNHDPKDSKETKLPSENFQQEETFVCCECTYSSGNPHRFAQHLVVAGHACGSPQVQPPEDRPPEVVVSKKEVLNKKEEAMPSDKKCDRKLTRLSSQASQRSK